MITLGELRAAVSFLGQANVLMEGVRDLFRDHDGIVAARLNDISQRIEDEREFVGRLIMKVPNGGAQKP